MASPVVAGTAAFLLSYYPNLTAQQVKYIIENSATTNIGEVTNPGSGATVPFAQLSKTGGLLNAAEAVKLAEQISGGKNGTKTANKDKKSTQPSKKQTAPVKSF
jgi:cell wall-associated protease